MSGTVAPSLRASLKAHPQTGRFQPEMANVQCIRTPKAASFSSSSNRRQHHSGDVGLQLRCCRAGNRGRVCSQPQNRVLQDAAGPAESAWGTRKVALRRSVRSLGFAFSLDILSAPSAIAADSPFLDGVDAIKHNLENFDWAGWADWHESPLATGAVSLWTQWTASVVSTAQPFELRPGESFSSALFYLSVVLLLSSLIAQPRQ